MLTEFHGEDIPFYAILSHRWENEEVTIEDLRSGLSKMRLGYEKVMGCCRRAREDGWMWVVSSFSWYLVG
jgi:nitrate reductase alpha subunit